MNSSNSFFVIDPTSWVATFLSGLFSPSAGLAQAIFMWNTGILVLAGTIFLLHSASVIIQTAHKGEVLGEKHLQIWFPIRLIFGLGLLVPLPPDGYNTGEYLVINVAKMGSALADNVWSTVTTAVGQGLPLAVPPAPDAARVVAALWQIAACTAIQNQSAASSNGPTISITAPAGQSYLSADGAVEAQCGSVFFPPPASGTLQQSVVTAQMYGVTKILNDLKPVAGQFATFALPPYSGAAPTWSPAGDLQQYSDSIASAASAAVESNSTTAQQRSDWSTAANKMGWVGAGAYAITLSRTQGQLTEASTTPPTITPPKIDWWVGDVYVNERAALAAANDWMGQQLHTAQRNATTAPDAFLAGVGEDSSFAAIDPARFRAVYQWMGANSNTSKDPVSSIMAMGHEMVSIATTTVATYVAAKGVAGAAAGVAGSIPIIGGAVVGIAKGITGAADAVSPAMWLGVGALWSEGVLLAYVIPMMPFIWLMLLLADWIIRIVVGVVAAPLWGTFHLTLEANAGLGSRAARGWGLLIDIFSRPTMAVLGLLLGYLVFQGVAGLVVQLFFDAAQGALAGHFGGLSGLLTLSILLVALLTTLMYKSMSLTHLLGDWVAQLLQVPTHAGTDAEKHATPVVAAVQTGAGQVASRAAPAVGYGGAKPHLEGGGGTMRPTRTSDHIAADRRE